MLFLLVVTLVSMLLAAIMSVIAWRVSQEERRRAEARVAALAAEIHAGSAPPAVSTRIDDYGVGRVDDAATRTAPRMFETTTRAGVSMPAIVGIGALTFLVATGIAVTIGRGSNTSGPSGRENLANPVKPATPEDRANPAPPDKPSTALELLALGHERDGERLTVRGVVRNPSQDALGGVTAVVFLFDRNGGFLTSGRAAIETGTLSAGGESTFVVTVPGAADASRYRVSFRTADRIVPHVDRRDHLQAKS